MSCIVHCIAVDHVREADLTDVASHREIVGVAQGTEIVAAVAAARIVAIGTASAVARAARARAKATTRVARGVAIEAGPAVVIVTTVARNSRKPEMARVAKKTTAKHPSLRDRMQMRTSRLIGKEVPRQLEMDPEIVHGVQLLKRPAIRAAAVADHLLIKVGRCC